MSANGVGLTIRRDVNIPYYEQLKRLVVQQIANDGLSTGDPLPSEGELCARYGVSRTVVRQAIGELVNDGLLQRMRGKGTFVARAKLREQFMESTVGFFEDLTARGHKVVSAVTSIDLVGATDKVSEALDIPIGASCIELSRVRSVNDDIVAFAKSYLNSSSTQLLEDLRSADLSRMSLYKFLDERWDMRIQSGHRSLEASTAKGKLARLLEVRPGSPVLYIESVGRDADGVAVEHFQAWHRADRTRLEMDVVRENRSGLITHG
ncbi:MAG: GntR family transcriptional regulator [Dactylosporangium sp.]|nr:GntR family transcriptional regulator [Dactylosporangium sp.]